MLARLVQQAGAPTAAMLRKHSHLVFILPQATKLAGSWPGRDVLQSLLARRQMKPAELGKAPVAGNLKDGSLAVWVMVDPGKSQFEAHSTVRSALRWNSPVATSADAFSPTSRST